MTILSVSPKTWSEETDKLEFGELGDLLGFHLRLAQTAMYRDFVSALSAIDLTQKQCATLSLIAANPGVPQIALVNRLGADRATMMAIVDRLEGKGLITRRRSTADRRRQELYITSQGETTLERARTAIAEHEKTFTSRLSDKELKSLITMLKRIHQQD